MFSLGYRRLENFAQTNFEIIFYQIGHSPAGGCVLALCCDYRIIVDGKFKIGLNETKLGIVAPPWYKFSLLQITLDVWRVKYFSMFNRIKTTFINTVGIRTTGINVLIYKHYI